MSRHASLLRHPRGASAGLIVAALVAAFSALLIVPASPSAAAGATAVGPKAYIGLFKDNAVAVVDTATDGLLTTIPVPAGPHGLAITPDGRKVSVSSDAASPVSVVDTATDRVTTTLEVGATPHGLAITPDGARVLVAGFGTGQVSAIDTATDQVVGRLPVASPHNIAVAPDGATAYVGSQAQGAFAIAVLDLRSWTETGSVALDKPPRALSVTPDGADLVFTLAGADAVQVMDLASRKIETSIPVGASPHHPLFSPDGKLGLVVSQGPGELALFDPASY